MRIILIIFTILVWSTPCSAVIEGCQYGVINYTTVDDTNVQGYANVHATCSGATSTGTAFNTTYNSTLDTYNCTANGWEFGATSPYTVRPVEIYTGNYVKYTTPLDRSSHIGMLPICLPATSECSDQEAAAELACGGASNIKMFDTETCEYECFSCQEVYVTDFTNCTEELIYTCEENKTPCSTYITGCVTSLDLQSNCVNCPDQKAAYKDQYCASNETLYDYDCTSDTGRCVPSTCADERSQCYSDCDGSISQFACQDSNSVANIIAPCLCVDGNPPDPEDPQEGDLDNALLKKIVTNTGLTVDELNEINDNTKSIAYSSTVTNDKLTTANSHLSGVNDKLTDSNNLLTGLGSDLSEIKTSSDNIETNTANTAAHAATSAVNSAGIKNNTFAMKLELEEIKNNTATTSDTLLDVFDFLSGDFLGLDSDVQSMKDSIDTESQTILSDTGQSIDTSVQGEVDLISTDVDSIVNNSPLGESIFDGVFTPFTSLFPAEQNCIPFEGNFPSLPEANFTIPCDLSDNFKLIFGWFLSVATLIYLYQTLTTRVVPYQ